MYYLNVNFEKSLTKLFLKKVVVTTSTKALSCLDGCSDDFEFTNARRYIVQNLDDFVRILM